MADVNLHANQAFQPAPFFVVINDIGCHDSVNPMLVMIAADNDSVIVPFVCGEILDCSDRADNPGLSGCVHHNLFACVSQNAATALFVKHAVVIVLVRDDVTLITRHNPLAQIGAFQEGLADRGYRPSVRHLE